MDLDRASALARRCLRSGLAQREFPDGRILTVLAGSPREFCWAAGGLLAEGLHGPVRAGLEVLLEIPSGAPDLGSLLCWTAARYCLAAPDHEWASEILPELEKAMVWYDAREADRLAPQEPFSDWKDTVRREGTVFFTQLLRWRALNSLSELCRRLGKLKACASWQGQARIIQRQAHKVFWDAKGGFFRDMPDLALLSCEANLAAVAWGFCDQEEGSLILRAMDRLGLNTPMGPKASQRYPFRQKSWRALLGGKGGRHDEEVWSWIAALNLLALRRLGRKALLEKALAGLCSPILASETVPETLPSGPASPWSAGLLLEAGLRP